MIDTGAGPNVIKHKILHSETAINRFDNLFLTGITNGRIETLGSVEVLVNGYPVKLYVVPDDFPIPQEGHLGAAFLRGASTINFEQNLLEWRGNKYSFVSSETLVIPARSKIVCYLRVRNDFVTKFGYVPPLSVCEGILIGNAVVTNIDGKAYVQAINTTEESVEILVPYVELQEIESLSTRGPVNPKKKQIATP
ncbi:hypothetical protein ALC62_09097 [Cyphomyrmex costatus]|uniref:Peptidase A2 domain-containing protein n=1 Tax=Cyphomyrmex costatus TaxID=456900 RepID=A0A151IFZ3_9HYME|nr:hypothetical protein ALC62_09097 [Cyphomyrmex costatus]